MISLGKKVLAHCAAAAIMASPALIVDDRVQFLVIQHRHGKSQAVLRICAQIYLLEELRAMHRVGRAPCDLWTELPSVISEGVMAVD